MFEKSDGYFSIDFNKRRKFGLLVSIAFSFVIVANNSNFIRAEVFRNHDGANEFNMYGYTRNGQQQLLSSRDVMRLQTLSAEQNLTVKNLLGFLQDSNPMYNSRIGMFLFTRYCGPGSRLWNKIFRNDKRTYAEIDSCCKMHDECPHYVEKLEDYYNYPGLDYRPQFFSR